MWARSQHLSSRTWYKIKISGHRSSAKLCKRNWHMTMEVSSTRLRLFILTFWELQIGIFKDFFLQICSRKESLTKTRCFACYSDVGWEDRSTIASTSPPIWTNHPPSLTFSGHSGFPGRQQAYTKLCTMFGTELNYHTDYGGWYANTLAAFETIHFWSQTVVTIPLTSPIWTHDQGALNHERKCDFRPWPSY